MEKIKTIAVIPSLNPDGNLYTIVKSLSDAGFAKILVVDDGSRESCKSIFGSIAGIEGCTVLTHPVNCGKGQALKTAFTYIRENGLDIPGVVTADADGQHTVEDICRTARALEENPQALILGTRNFNEPEVPLKSRSGNKITTAVFLAMFSKKINDTQTGLRGIPKSWLCECIETPGVRFDYEINMLIRAAKTGIEIIEVPISTIYFNDNRETHFRPFRDSARIYSIMLSGFLKYSCSGVVSTLADFAIFTALTHLVFQNLDPLICTFLGTALARVCSAVLNYSVNRRVVFADRGRVAKSAPRYVALCICQALCSWLLVAGLSALLHIDVSIAKIPVDICLFFISFQIQQHWVFKS